MRSFLEASEEHKSLQTMIVKITGLLLSSDGTTVDGETTTWYRVLTGAGRYVRHYSEVGKKQPNTALVLRTANGINDDLVELVVKTHNKCGISAGNPLLLDYGLTYDHHRVKEAVKGEPDAKRFKGILEGYFAKLGTEEATATVQKMMMQDAGESAPPETAGEKKTADEKKNTADEKKNTADENKNTADETKSKSDLTDKGLVQLAEGEVNMATLTEPVKCVLAFKPPSADGKFAGSLSLVATEPMANNAKMRRETILWSAKAGHLTATKEETGPPFQFSRTKQTLVADTDKGRPYMCGAVQTLHEFMQKNKVTEVAKHKAFTGVPLCLTAESNFSFVPNDELPWQKQFWAYVKQLAEVDIIWRVFVKEQKLLPMAPVVISKKQLILQATGRLELK